MDPRRRAYLEATGQLKPTLGNNDSTDDNMDDDLWKGGTSGGLADQLTQALLQQKMNSAPTPTPTPPPSMSSPPPSAIPHPSPSPTDPAQILARHGGSFENMFNDVDMQRNGMMPRDPVMRSLTPEQLAQADRYATGGRSAQHMQDVGGWPLKTLGLPVVGGMGAGYEALKHPAVMNTLADMLDYMRVPDSSRFSGNQFRVQPNTSKPSMDNIMALLNGYLAQ